MRVVNTDVEAWWRCPYCGTKNDDGDSYCSYCNRNPNDGDDYDDD